MRSHRRLFPTNESGCPDNLCDPDCPFGDCSPYPYLPATPSPPPPPPPTSDHSFQLSPLLIVVIALISALVVLISYYFIAVRRRTPPARRNASEETGQIGDDERLVDHHIWLINTVGLQQSVISAITVVQYRRGDGLIEGTDCSVCLSEFREGETLRLLPKCSHAFHVGCIDTWLRSHTNCPMCRAHIVVSGTAGPSRASSSFGNSRRNEAEITEVELANNDTENQEAVADVLTGDLNEQNKAELGFEHGTKLVRRCVSMSYINLCASTGDGQEHWYLCNRASMRRSCSSGARLHDRSC